MNNPICISTGFVYRIIQNRNEMIRLIKKFAPDGIQVLFPSVKDLLDFKIEADVLDYLKKLSFNSIHAPWGVVYVRNKDTRNLLQAIQDLYIKIGAGSIVFEIDEKSDPSIFAEYDFQSSVENFDWRKTSDFKTIEGLERILNENKFLKLTFDFAHALTVSKNNIQIYIEKFGNRIAAFHLSYLSPELKDHWFLHKHDSEEMRRLIAPLKKINVPIVIESVASDKSELELMKPEIEYVRKIFE